MLLRQKRLYLDEQLLLDQVRDGLPTLGRDLLDQLLHCDVVEAAFLHHLEKKALDQSIDNSSVQQSCGTDCYMDRARDQISDRP